MQEPDFTLKIEQDVKISPIDIDGIMVTALEGGITYWCNEARTVGEFLGSYASDQISRNGTLILHDSEDDKNYELTLAKFLEGLKLYIEDGNTEALCDGRIDPGNIDADGADSIIQYAIFGEVIFG